MKFNYIALTLITLCAPLMANWRGEKVELTNPKGVTISVMKKIYTTPQGDKSSIPNLGEPVRSINSATCPHNFQEWTHDNRYYQAHFGFDYTIEFLSSTISPQNIGKMLAIPTVTDGVTHHLRYWTPHSPHIEDAQEYCLMVVGTEGKDNSYLDQWFEIQKNNLKKAIRHGQTYRVTTYVDGKIATCTDSYSTRLTKWITKNPLLAALAGLSLASASYFMYTYFNKK